MQRLVASWFCGKLAVLEDLGVVAMQLGGLPCKEHVLLCFLQLGVVHPSNQAGSQPVCSVQCTVTKSYYAPPLL